MDSQEPKLNSLRGRMPGELFWYAIMIKTANLVDHSVRLVAQDKLDIPLAEISAIRSAIGDAAIDEFEQ